MKPFQIGKHYPKFDNITVDRAVGEINTYAGGTANQTKSGGWQWGSPYQSLAPTSNPASGNSSYLEIHLYPYEMIYMQGYSLQHDL